MASTSVQGVSGGAAVNQLMTANTKEAKQGQEDGRASFDAMLKKQSMAQGKNLKEQDVNSSVKTTKTETESPIARRDSIKIEDAPKELPKDPEEMKELIGKIEEGIKKILSEETDLSEEEIEDAMATLGLTYTDLLIPENLVALVAEATGTEDKTELLLNQNLNGIMGQVNELVTNLTEESGISVEELVKAGMQIEEAPPEETLPADFVVPENKPETKTIPPLPETNTAQKDDAAPAQKVETTPDRETVNVKTETTDTAEAPEKEAVREKNGAEVESTYREPAPKSEEIRTQDLTEETPDETEAVAIQEGVQTEGEEENLSQNMGSKEENASQDLTKEEKTELPKGEEHAAAAHNAQAPGNEFRIQQPEAVQEPPRPAVDPRELMNQIQEFARTRINADTTSVEMQLNPAHLGRLLINVTEQQGNLTARIETMNLAVKEALEAQIANLRSTLENAGMKVTEVEVTVASHEFERNLEEGNTQMQQEGQPGERENRQGERRTLRSDDLDGMSGLMSEEEQLAARIMLDNGNTMDAKA